MQELVNQEYTKDEKKFKQMKTAIITMFNMMNKNN